MQLSDTVENHQNDDTNDNDKLDEIMSEVSETTLDATPAKKRPSASKSKKQPASKKKKMDPPEEDIDDTTNITDASSHQDFMDEMAEDEILPPEELQKKIDKTSRKLIKKRDESR